MSRVQADGRYEPPTQKASILKCYSGDYDFSTHVASRSGLDSPAEETMQSTSGVSFESSSRPDEEGQQIERGRRKDLHSGSEEGSAR